MATVKIRQSVFLITIIFAGTDFNGVYGVIPPQDSFPKPLPLEHPYVNATAGNVMGIVAGGFLGAIIATGIWGEEVEGNPDANWGNVGIAAAGFYFGAVTGFALGTTIALSMGRAGPYDVWILKRGESLKILGLSLTPYIVPTLQLVSRRGGWGSFKATLTISFSLSVALPVRYYIN